mmetsp:Transcript_22977/g.38747  ORF Transcript_22977/g.38747 Transcript_22977/m.38747 type:complete len:164 (+) Transcript_22977:897-1388(+)
MIRPAQTDDAAWIAAIWCDVIARTLITFTTDPKTEDEVAQMIDTRPVLVLEDQGGFASFGSFRGGPGYAATVEHTVMLAPKAQGRGHGRALMTGLMDVARAQEKHVMVAGISGANPKAVAFHAALGFQQTGQMSQVGRKNGQWLDLILMEKLLNPPDTALAKG